MTNNEYTQDTHYTLKNLDSEQITELLEDAYLKSFNFRVDILDCRKSWHRKEIKMSFKDIMNKVEDKNTFYIFIHRKGDENAKNNKKVFPEEWCLEIGFRTMNSPDYFLWLHLHEDKLDFYLNKYNIKKNGE